ncbi:unnamed protein product [Bemisia tabaci]|uniref:Uncharacterized protein n=1 Tax=Bemisia tabaci TaxID=7038 RepID=A0A9P0A191_BEMTA|nr:unnamed protein product [Bemisia tabaci]
MRIRKEKKEAKMQEQEENKLKMGKRKRQPSKKKITEILAAETSSEESDVDAPASEEEENSSDEMALGNFSENSYVIVCYEGEYFPGLVISKKDNGADVKVMTMSGSDWKWPAKEDKLFYENEDIVRNMEPPVLKNARGLYSVPEIKFYRKHLAV